MNIINHPQALTTATNLVAKQICGGIVCVGTFLRMNGDLMEWHMDNGDVIEVLRSRDFSDHKPVNITVTHYRETADGDEFITLYEKNFEL